MATVVDIGYTCYNTLFYWGSNATNMLGVYDQLENFNNSFQGYHIWLSMLICAFGVIANIITMIVFTRPVMINNVNVFLVAIAFCDGLVMASYLVFILHYKLFTVEDCDRSRYTYYWVAYTWLHANLTLVLHGSALWIGVALALVRYLMISSHQPSQFSRRRSNGIVLAITILSTVAFIPNYLSLKIERNGHYFTNCSNVVGNTTAAYQLNYNNKLNPQEACWLLRTTFYTQGLLFKILPCILLTILISMLIYVMCQANMRRKNLKMSAAAGDSVHMSYKRRMSIETDSTTRMLICLLLISLITEIPQGILSLISGLSDTEFRQKFYENVADLLDLLSVTNSAINFPLYCVMSKGFRNNFVSMLKTPCRWALKNLNPCGWDGGRKQSQILSLSTSLGHDSFERNENVKENETLL